MNTLWLTLYRGAGDLLAFTIGLGVCLIGFSFFGHQAFGSRLGNYSTYQSSLSTLLNYMQGQFSYTDLSEARPWISWVYFGFV